MVRNMRRIIRDELIVHSFDVGAREFSALACKPEFDHTPCAGPDHVSRLIERHWWPACACKHDVQRGDQIRRRIDQRSIKIEYDCWPGHDRSLTGALRCGKP